MRIALIDTGVDASHPDLKGQVDTANSRDFTGDGSVIDRNGHGTHVASIICGSGLSSDGRFQGIAPGVELVALKAFYPDEAPNQDLIAAAVKAAMDCGADIINFSATETAPNIPSPWVWSALKQIYESAFATAAAAGILCVGAAGNEGLSGSGSGTVLPPGIRQTFLTVGSVGPKGLVETSSRGPARLDNGLPPGGFRRARAHERSRPYLKPDVLAPGSGSTRLRTGEATREGIVAARSSACKLDEVIPGHTFMQGTSQATAVVTGLAALALDLARRLQMDLGPNPGTFLQRVLRASARRLDHLDDDAQGRGLLHWSLIVATLEDASRNPELLEQLKDGNSL